MVRALTKKIIKMGIQRNRGLISAEFLAKKVSSQKKEKRAAARKAPINRKAMGEPK